MDQIAACWCISERPFRNLPKGILRKVLRGLSQFLLSSSANSRRVPAPGNTLRDLTHPLKETKSTCSLERNGRVEFAARI